MNPSRFNALADAYGADLERWPEAERAAARAHLRDHPDARSSLAAARDLDLALAGWTMEGPGSALAARIAAIAAPRTHVRRLRLFLSGLGATAALAGLAAGAVFVASMAQPGVADADGTLTVLGAPLDMPSSANRP